MQPIRISLSGKMMSGKSTIAEHLIQLHGFRAVNFADELKEMAAQLFPSARHRKDRRVLQTFGQRMRDLDADVWVRKLEEKLDQMEGQQIVVADTRYPNEYAPLRRMGFKMARVNVHPVVQQQRYNALDNPGYDLLEANKHPSETALDTMPSPMWDWVIQSTDAPESVLIDQVDAMLGAFIAGGH